MTQQEKEIQKQQHNIAREIKELFENRMDQFDMDIPENDHREAAKLIYKAMQETLDMLKHEIDKGTYDNF
ncbi:MAG TPA: hypothetical protein EYH42_01140 [Sulfurovum sp.]|nr:hypothetical protein [Sulfurovum sp.]